jgi:hypothetical protein
MPHDFNNDVRDLWGNGNDFLTFWPILALIGSEFDFLDELLLDFGLKYSVEQM